jgi:large repetitive protein
MNFKIHRAKRLLFLVALALPGIAAPADTHTWNGGGGDNNWNTPANWGGAAPAGGDSLIFAGTNRLAPQNNFTAGTAFSNVTFDSTAGTFMLGGNSFALTGELLNSSFNLQTLGLGFSCSSTGYVNTATADITINGVITGAGTLFKRGDRKLTLTGTNTYSAGTAIAGGTLSIGKDYPLTPTLGTTNCAITLAGGALEVTGPLFGVNTNVLWRMVRLGAGGGVITNASGNVLYLGREGNFFGTNEVIIGGTTANGLTTCGEIGIRPGAQNTLGKLTVYSGRTFLRNQANHSYPVAGSDRIAVNSGASLVFVDRMPRSITNVMAFASGAVLCNRTNGDSTGVMTLSTTNVHFPDEGTMIFNSDDQFTTNIVINGSWPDLTGDLTIQVGGANASIGPVTLNGPLGGDHAFTKTSSGALIFNATNNYAGGTTVNGGLLDVRKDGGLGSGNVSITGGAALKLSSGTANNYIGDTASLFLNGSATVNLAYTGTDTIGGLSFDGGATLQAYGTWGSATSSAANKDSHFTGNGILNVVMTTVTTLSSSTNPSLYGQLVTIAATVTATESTPTGTVQFITNGINFGSAATLVGGSATSGALPATLPAGAYTVAAVYIPSGAFGVSTGVLAGGQTVNPLPVNLAGRRVYDGTATAAAAILTVANKVGSDDVTVVSGNGTLAGTAAGDQAIISLGTLALGGTAAGNYTLTGATGVVTIVAGSVAQVNVETAADGSGIIAGMQSIRSGNPFTVYAISRDSGGNFVANSPAEWSLTNVTGGVAVGDLAVQPDGKSATFIGHAAGTARIQTVSSGFSGLSGVLAVPIDAGTIHLPLFEDAVIGTFQPAYPAQTWWVNGTNNNQYAQWSIGAGEGVGGSAAAVAHPGANATGGSASYIQALRVYYFPVWSNTLYTIRFFYKTIGPGFNGAGNSGSSEMQLQVLESPNPDGGGYTWPNGLNLNLPATNWTTATCTFTTLPTTRCLCLKFGMMFGDGNRADPADSFYLDDDRGTTNLLSSSANPAVFGQPVSFTATINPVSPGIGTPAGTVQFKTNGVDFGAAVILSGGSATSDVLPATLPPGTYPVTADYSGDGNFTVSTGTLAGGQMIYRLPELQIGAGGPAGRDFIIVWPGMTSWCYTVQYSPSLCPAMWSNLPAYTSVTGWDGTMSATNDTSHSEKMFYRIQLTPPEP